VCHRESKGCRSVVEYAQQPERVKTLPPRPRRLLFGRRRTRRRLFAVAQTAWHHRRVALRLCSGSSWARRTVAGTGPPQL